MSSFITKSKLDKNDIPIAYNTEKEEYVLLNTSLPKLIKGDEIVGNFKMIPYLNTKSNQRSATYISGISGSGKSTFARGIADELIKITKPKMVCLFTQTQEVDPVFQDLHDKEMKRLENWSFR